MRIRSRLLVLLVLASALFFSASGSASAWTRGNVWVNFAPTNCPSGGSVVGIYWVVDGLSAGPPGGDWNDNVIYPTVRINGSNRLSYELRCKKWGWFVYWGKKSQQTLTPYKSGLSYTYW